MKYFTNFHKLNVYLVDFSKGYYHIKLDEASSLFATFNTLLIGRFRFTRISFGLTVIGDAFQWKVGSFFSNLDFCISIADDMIIWGKQPDGSDWDKHLTEFLQVTRKTNLKLNINKL